MKFTVYIPLSVQLLKTKIGLVAKEKGGISQKKFAQKTTDIVRMDAGWRLTAVGHLREIRKIKMCSL